MSEPEREAGTIIKRVGPVAIMCMDPDARDALDEAIAAYKQFKGWSGDDLPDGVYQFAYWLYRYSGLVEQERRPAPADQEAGHRE